MGACLSCCGDSNSGSGNESGERTHLLSDPVGGSSSNIRVQSEDYSSRGANSVPGKDEQSALSRILHQTATNVIDVGALDSHDLEQHEYYERMKAYSARLNGLVRWSPPRQGLILVDVPSHEKCLAPEPISPETLFLITSATERLTRAVSQIKVEHKEDLVVPFRIP